jgi:hypothetical protein
MLLIDPEDGSRLHYLVTGTIVAVTLDDGSEVDSFTLPAGLEDEADVALWLLDHHLTVMAWEAGGPEAPPEE